MAISALALALCVVPVWYTLMLAIDGKLVNQRAVYREVLLSHPTPRYDALYAEFCAHNKVGVK